MFLGNKQTEKEVKTILVLVGFIFYLFCILNGWLGSETKFLIEADQKDVDVSEVENNRLESQPVPLTIEEKIVKEFGNDGDTALAIATAEHSGSIDPNAVNSTEVEHSVGVFQINLAAGYGNGKRVHWDKAEGKTLEEKEAWLKVPENNISTAKDIFEESYWWPWSVFKNGRFKKFLEIE